MKTASRDVLQSAFKQSFASQTEGARTVRGGGRYTGTRGAGVGASLSLTQMTQDRHDPAAALPAPVDAVDALDVTVVVEEEDGGEGGESKGGDGGEAEGETGGGAKSQEGDIAQGSTPPVL